MSIRRFVLASQSPRRRQILTIAGYEFDILPSQISEIPDENLNVTSQIRQLARDKAKACLKMRNASKGQGILLLAADTVVVLADQILGKPKDEVEARSFLRRLSGQTHDVMTAVCLVDIDTDQWLEDIAVTRVRFRHLLDSEIEAYIATGEPMDKAGGYGIQGAAAPFVESIDGPYDNVVGLPMGAVEGLLDQLGKTLKFTLPRRNRVIGKNLAHVQAQIVQACQKANRSVDEIKIIAVSKTKPATDVLEAIQHQQRIFGENYVQEALPKIAEVQELLGVAGRAGVDLEWHFIGGLQSKKAKQVVGAFSLIHSVDRISLLEELNKRALEAGICQRILLQMNIAEEPTKSGATRAQFEELVAQAATAKGLQLCGVMAMPPLTDEESLARRRFAEVRELFQAARKRLPEAMRSAFKELSMGTTHDLEWAILEGATMVRIGTAIFGKRD